MRRRLLSEGAKELSYEIREIVKKANQLKALGLPIHWENIGDPIEKKCQVPDWIKDIVVDLVRTNRSYGYCPSKGMLETREFLVKENNKLGGAQINVDDILFFNGLGDAIATIYGLLSMNTRIIGPAPAYSTHSSAEAAHAHTAPITYRLQPENHWYPDLEELENKVKYNPSIAGILILNPDNPTGMVYPLEISPSATASSSSATKSITRLRTMAPMLMRSPNTSAMSRALRSRAFPRNTRGRALVVAGQNTTTATRTNSSTPSAALSTTPRWSKFAPRRSRR